MLTDHKEFRAMNGRNHLILCMAEVRVALQEYLHKRWPVATPQIDGIDLRTGDAGGAVIDVSLSSGVAAASPDGGPNAES